VINEASVYYEGRPKALAQLLLLLTADSVHRLSYNYQKGRLNILAILMVKTKAMAVEVPKAVVWQELPVVPLPQMMMATNIRNHCM